MFHLKKPSALTYKHLITLLALFSFSVYASAEDPAVKGLIGAVMALQVMIFVGLYHTGKFLCRKAISEASLLLQRVSGVAFSFLSYVLLLALLK